MFGLKKWKRRFQAVAFLTFVAGLGMAGVIHRDDPFVKGLIALVRTQAGLGPPAPTADGRPEPESKPKVGDFVAEASSILSGIAHEVSGNPADDRRPGSYDVAVDSVRLDGREFRAGNPVEIEARVIRRGRDGAKPEIVWSSLRIPDHARPARPAVAGTGPIVAGWPGASFRVAWDPSDQFSLEVWDIKAGRAIECFTLDVADDGRFPLRSRTLTLSVRADGHRALDPSANTVALVARRVAESDPAVKPASAEARRSTRR